MKFLTYCYTLALLFLIRIPALSLAANNPPPSLSKIQNTTDPEVVTNDDLLTTFENTTWFTPVLNNDYGLTEGVQSLTITKKPRHGKAEVMPDYTIRYIPDFLFVGFDEFEYQVCNTYNSCGRAKVTVEIMDFDYKPIAVNDTIRVYDEDNLLLNVLNNDQYLYDLPIRFSVVTELTHGYSEIITENTIRPYFVSYFLGMDSLQYEVCDVQGDCARAWAFFVLNPGYSDNFNIPSGFSPNGDGYNDTFYSIDFQYYTGTYIRIMDRNGYLVFEDKNYNNQWDGVGNKGVYTGKLAAPGPYYYMIRLQGLNKDVTGVIYLNR